MLHSWGGRIATILVLLALLVGLMVGFGGLDPAPTQGDYPSEDELATDYAEHIGQTVHLSGVVIDTDPVVIRVDYDYYATGVRYTGSYDLTIQEISSTDGVTDGDSLQVYGTVRPDHTLTAQNVVVVPPRNYAYMYTISALAGLWVLTRLIRGWRLDWATGALERRPTTETHTRLRDRLTEVFD